MNKRIVKVENLNNVPMRDILVVVPTYNECENVNFLIDAVASEGCDLLFVDDASPDGTPDAIRAKAESVPIRMMLMRRAKKLGLGTAYIDAFQWIIENQPKYRVVVQMDADLSHQPSNIKPLAEVALRGGLAIGSRYIAGGKMPGWPLHRRLLSRFANLYVERVLGASLHGTVIHDSTAGFVAWKRDALEHVFSTPVMSNGYAFQIETKFRAIRAGFTPTELPITFPDRSRGVSKINRSIILEAIRLPWKLRRESRENRHVCPSCNVNTRFFIHKNTYDIWRCHNCGLLFIWPSLKTTPSEIYQEEYFSGATGGFGYVDYDADKSVLSGFFRKILDQLSERLGKTGSLLDIGAATGHFVGLARTAGWDAKGIDVSSHSAGIAKMKGLPVEATTLNDLDSRNENFDVITMWDVIEHLPNPFGAIQKVSRLLKSGGLVAIMTPDARSLWARLWGKHWHAIVPPEHLFLFSEHSLKKILEDAGLEILEIKHPVKSFTIPYILNTGARWLGFRIPKKLMGAVRHSFLGQLTLPLPLRDNLLLVARKRDKHV